ncbi:MAG TPA: penicillin-binding protein 2 [Phycisphaerales bacterium]|nr:penicillin-binding protein 2 [Phycisphaerales bacterium]HIO19487.1 penicillin-binding protein 2 [Phycisphaerales bacterium]
MNNSNNIAPRITRVALLFIAIVTFLMGSSLYIVVQLKVSPPDKLAIATGSVTSTTRQLALRGQIYDRQGRLLAASRIGEKLFVDATLIKNVVTLSFELGEILSIPPAQIEEELRRKATKRYIVIKELLNDEEVHAINELRRRCVGLEEILVREYPHGGIGGPLIGIVGTDHKGLAGFESIFENVLAGTPGKFVRIRDTKRNTIWVSPIGLTPKTNGKNVQLSIDVVIQEIAYRRLQEEVIRCNAGGGRILVVEPETGEILAMADVLNPRDGWSQQPEDANRKIDPRLGRNRCVTDPYEPGSTFKPFIWSYATQLGKATPDEILQTPANGPYRTSFGRTIRDAHYYGPSTWRKVLIKSMNSGMAIVAQRLSYAQLQEALKRFGFGETTRVGLGGETRGIVTSPSSWSDYTQTSVPMGQEIAVTPLQMVQGFCAFARDGTVPQLKLKPSTDEDVMFVREAITPEIAALTRQIMGQVMTEGTGKKSQSDLYALFGKSGTAQLPKTDGKGYFEDRYIASFIAGAPIDNPKLVVLCVIDDPDKSIGHYGGVVAGPVVRDVIEETLQYLRVPVSSEFLANAN